MPGADEAFVPIVGGCEFRLWWDVPEGCWLRRQGSTRVLLIDDQFTSRERLLGLPDGAPPSPDEARLQRWMNTELQFIGTPDDYRWDGKLVPEGTFDAAWLDKGLTRALEDPRPIAAVLLDLLYGHETRPQEASGRRFLALLRKRLPGVPVFITSNVRETPEVLELLKRGDGDGESSFQDYLPKNEPGDRRPLLQRLCDKLAEWGEVSDPDLSAFSRPMRRLARQMRRLVLHPQRIAYEEAGAGDFPVPVVIGGEYGSGKNYVATRLHAMSSRRNAPLAQVNLGALSADGLPITLFGTAAFTGAAQCFEIRLSDGAVLRTIPAATAQKNAQEGVAYLGKIGVLQHVDIASQPFGPTQQPLGGSVVIDEIGSASEVGQTCFRAVLNNGRFTPHLMHVQIPSSRAIDVWFLVTLSPEGKQNLRSDLAGRLDKGFRLEVPPLRLRKEDIVALALRLAGVDPSSGPEDVFTTGALKLLDQRADRMQVRALEAIIRRLRDITSKLPYSARDLEDAGLLDGSQALSPEPPPPQVAAPAADTTRERSAISDAVPDDLAVLARWRSDGVLYALDPRSPRALQGRGRDVRGGAAVAMLSFLEMCATISAPDGRYSLTRTWKFFAGLDESTGDDAGTRIARMFLVDEDATLAALRRSDALLWLAIAVTKRRGDVGKLLDKLELEPEQRPRIARLRAERRSKAELEE